jgi:hypothetical protein
MFEVFWEDADGYLKFQRKDGNIFAHSEIFNWSKSVYLKALDVWEVAKEELAQEGFDSIYVAIPANDRKLIKFEKLFGFQPLATHEGILYMVCSTGVDNGS